MAVYKSKLTHFLLLNTAISQSYTSPNQFPRVKYPNRNRLQHADHLLSQITKIYEEKKKGDIVESKTTESEGIFLEFEGSPGFSLDLKKLDLPSSNIELLNVKKSKQDNGQELINATVFVPEGKLPVFIKKLNNIKMKKQKKVTLKIMI